MVKILFQNSDSKSVPRSVLNANAPGASPRRYGAPVAMTLGIR